jgi:hypothetical protein
MRRWIDEISFGMRVVLTVFVVAITIAVILWDVIKEAVLGLQILLLRVAHPVARIFSAERLACIDDALALLISS